MSVQTGGAGGSAVVARLARRACMLAAFALALLALVAPSLAPARAQEGDPEAGRPTAFVADAESFASQVLVNTVPPQFFSELLNARAPFATSHFETGSTSTAKASMLNPGLAVTGIATVCQVGIPCDQIPNFPPPYPLLADASFPLAPDATAAITGGTLSLGPLAARAGDARAHAGRDKVTADATAAGEVLGPGLAPLVTVGNATATNDLAFDDAGTLVATSIAAVGDVNVLGLLHIDSVEARSISSANADGTLNNDVHLDVSGATLAGIPITIGADGVALGSDPQGGDILSQLGQALTPLLGGFRGTIRTLGVSDQRDASGASGSATGLAIELFPNIDQAAGVSPTITVLLGFAGSHAYAFDAPPFTSSGSGTSNGTGTGASTAGGAGTPGRAGTPARNVPGSSGATSNGPGPLVEEVVSSLLAGAAAARLKLFYLAWTLSMIALAFGSRLRPARLNGAIRVDKP
ncbi:MAG: hypothetical protein ACR2LQ_10725 [Acidimicrobiales bacterium]